MEELKEMMAEFEKDFAKLKAELKFKPTLKELDDAFYLRDFIAKEGFISEKLSRQICRRIVDSILNWAQYLHNLIMANPSSLISMAESNAFTEEEKSGMNKMLAKIMALVTKNNLAGLKEDDRLEKEFIDESYSLWINELEKDMIKITEKASHLWHDKAKTDSEKKIKKKDMMYG